MGTVPVSNSPLISFSYLKYSDFPVYAPELFRILAGNMTLIAPTGNSYEEDYQFWLSCNQNQLRDSHRRLILIRMGNSEEVIGYFMYRLENSVWYMEEIQFLPAFQHSYGIFRSLYGYLLASLSEKPTYVEAYAHKNNEKSIAVLTHLGLSPLPSTPSRNSIHFRGLFSDLLRWYYRTPR